METKESRQPSRFGLLAILAIGALTVVGLLLSALPDSVSLAQQRQRTSSRTVVFTETFESVISTTWAITDATGPDNGEFYWATTTYTASEGAASAWATGGGADGSLLDPGVDDYPNNALSYMIRGPLNLSGTTGAHLAFDVWLDTEEDLDVLQVVASTDGVSYQSLATLSGNSGGWITHTANLEAYAGEPQVWVGFRFSSNAANTALGAFVDNVTLETVVGSEFYLPYIRRDPTPTPTSTPTPTPTPSPTPTNTPSPFYYYEDFDDGPGGWPEVDHTWDPTDCFRWYQAEGVYRLNVCDDRTDVKVSPGVDLPNGDYEIEVDARFRHDGGWWTSYGIIFDGKDDPDPNNPDLGDYYMVWVLWEGADAHKWKILKDIPGDQIDITSWTNIPSSFYNYGDNGLEWNNWRIVRTENRIRVYVNDNLLADVADSRPRTNNQIWFGVFGSTYETGINRNAWDNFIVRDLAGTQGPWRGAPDPFYGPANLDMDRLLPSD